VLEKSGLSLKDKLPGASTTVAEALMAPTKIYVKQVIYDSLRHSSLFYFLNSLPF